MAFCLCKTICTKGDADTEVLPFAFSFSGPLIDKPFPFLFGFLSIVVSAAQPVRGT